MNALNFFKFLEKEKGRPIPVRLKIIHGLSLTPDELNGEVYLDLRGTLVTSLPKGLAVNGNIYAAYTPIKSLPPDLKVEGSIWINNTPLAKKTDEEIRTMLKTGYIRGDIYK